MAFMVNRFVPNPNATSEDDGVVMTIAYDPSLRKSFLWY